MHDAFVALFVTGGLATALLAVFGHIGGHAGTHGHMSGPAGHGSHALAHGSHGHPAAVKGHGAGHLDSGVHPVGGHGREWLGDSFGWISSWVSPLTLAAAALWFGGVGLLSEGWSGRFTMLLAILAALVGAALVRALLRALIRAATPPLVLSGEGAEGTVNVTIKPDGPGEVIYTLEGLHRSVAARSIDGTLIPRGTSVIIVRLDGGYAWVEPLYPLAVTPGPVAASAIVAQLDSEVRQSSRTDVGTEERNER